MKITDLLKKDTIILDLQADAKEAVLSEIIEQLDRAGRLNDKEAFKQDILAREAQSTTGVGEAIAIPQDRKSTRLNSSHVAISYAVFCLKKKKCRDEENCGWQ